LSAQKKGKREYLKDVETRDFTAQLNAYFETAVEVPRIKVGQRQTVETLINEEASLFAMFLRKERKTWTPRIAEYVLQKTKIFRLLDSITSRGI